MLGVRDRRIWLLAIMRDQRDKIVVLTGGGTAGHVMPNLALLPYLRDAGFRSVYIGSNGIEKEIVTGAGLEFHTIHSGKLRRYASIENFKDVFKVLMGMIQAFFLLGRIRPACVFSKGGFVAVPVAIAAWARGIPVISHESDVSPGLANRIIARFAKMNLYAFPETGRYLVGRPCRQVGTPVRQSIYSADRRRGFEVCGWNPGSMPVVLFMGGSQGAQFINDQVYAALPELLEFCRVIHLTGRGKQQDLAPLDLPSKEAATTSERDKFLQRHGDNYRAFEFLGSELPDVLACADVVVSRAGANSIFELRALNKPMILIPLEKGSRGDQILNAESFRQNGWARVLRESDLSVQSLVAMVRQAVTTAAEEPRGGMLNQNSDLIPADLIVSEIRAVAHR